PLTVAPLAGCVMNTCSVGFCTCTYVKPLPVLLVASCTLALIVREPLATVVVSQFHVTVVALLAITVCCTPSTKTVNRLFVPLVPDTVICTGTVPFTVWPGTMFGNVTCSVPGFVLLLTVTERVAVAVAPLASRTVRPSVWTPSCTDLVSQE